MKKIHNTNGSHKKIQVAIVIVDKTDFKIEEKCYQRCKRAFYNDENVNPLGRYNNYKIYAPNNIAPKMHEAKPHRIKVKRVNSTVIVKSFDAPLSVMDRTT